MEDKKSQSCVPLSLWTLKYAQQPQRNCTFMNSASVHIFLRSIGDIVGVMAWQDRSQLEDLKRLYAAKFKSDLELDLEGELHP